ncbi:uncharacterized protein TEOVI_000871900 [Trypanosoma equiperdum]|uniref:Uncharacterized protein n=4 Tax=Trypanozoon TaxID=39700 RepID=Q38FZ4_TRYB2|nr:hypothetical protein, conserved [Trypanosoma brucei gambiense DAL972]XP_803441.1 hypothetical protein, conserved [Trypanosoma brucei brucei TREU927]RHW67342.1 hypothetical protein DPX39_000023100 [Trypanosoma brucei equiperdum]SCU68484.1 hypothetical protein, conserved [Trypanosoma equiperdum]EAN76276.1 hypothetical protein, conserved [Trypanosoma brucei brucei TREU927]CBH13952.1 hypothetical protein, conserved [Trypanosoma brucei gambiense DAL972]|eukprot:XP_011776226.1 hypothetical protein, conserved [Trypanosoma brucei gambiense DAL972]
MAPAVIEIHIPLDRIRNEEYATDDLLLNCLSKIGDTPEEDGLPLRTWILREAHQALIKSPKLRTVLVKPQTVKDKPTHFQICFDE